MVSNYGSMHMCIDWAALQIAVRISAKDTSNVRSDSKYFGGQYLLYILLKLKIRMRVLAEVLRLSQMAMLILPIVIRLMTHNVKLLHHTP